MELTTRQQQVVEAIKSLTDEQGVPPTVREIAARTTRTTSTTHEMLQTLKRLQAISSRPGTARSIRIIL